jgi:hypothetical protein
MPKKKQYDYWYAEEESIAYLLKKRKIKAEDVPLEYLIREAFDILEEEEGMELCFFHDNIRVYSIDGIFVIRHPWTQNLGGHTKYTGTVAFDKEVRPILQKELQYIRTVSV